MKKVLLINQEKIPHYRISVYNHLSGYLEQRGYELTVASDGIEEGNTQHIKFVHADMRLSFWNLAKALLILNPDAVIYWVRLRHLYLFPILILIKLLGIKAIYWGHGSDWAKKENMRLKTWANWIEYTLSDALVLYAEHQREHVSRRFEPKIFIANNTLCFDEFKHPSINHGMLLEQYNVTTSKNILCMGRMQKRKRLDDLFAAFRMLNRDDTGLILVGPDTDGVLQNVEGRHIYKLGPIYGTKRLDLLASADIFCLPGAVGLGIVDAFYCGLPLVTEAGDESPEIMYLKDGVNGFIVPRGDVRELSAKLALLLDNPDLRSRFACEAKKEISTNGHIDKMCEGFCKALDFVFCKPGVAR